MKIVFQQKIELKLKTCLTSYNGPTIFGLENDVNQKMNIIQLSFLHSLKYEIRSSKGSLVYILKSLAFVF